jgi:predicted transcriptional regulator
MIHPNSNAADRPHETKDNLNRVIFQKMQAATVITIATIREAVNMPANELTWRFGDLEKAGKIRKTGKKHYSRHKNGRTLPYQVWDIVEVTVIPEWIERKELIED